MLSLPSRLAFFAAAALGASALSGCIFNAPNQLYLGDANAERQADDHVLTRARIRCDGECPGEERYCIEVTWKDASTSDVLSEDKACSDETLDTGDLVTLEVITKVKVPVGPSVVGEIVLVDGAGRRIPNGLSSLGAAEDTEQPLANP